MPHSLFNVRYKMMHYYLWFKKPTTILKNETFEQHEVIKHFLKCKRFVDAVWHWHLQGCRFIILTWGRVYRTDISDSVHSNLVKMQSAFHSAWSMLTKWANLAGDPEGLQSAGSADGLRFGPLCNTHRDAHKQRQCHALSGTPGQCCLYRVREEKWSVNPGGAVT